MPTPKNELDQIIRNFMLLEGQEIAAPDIFTHTQAAMQLLDKFSTRSIKEQRNIAIMRQHLREILKYAKRLVEETKTLKEELAMSAGAVEGAGQLVMEKEVAPNAK